MSQTCPCGRAVSDAYVCNRCATDGRGNLDAIIDDLVTDLIDAATRQAVFGAQFRDFVTGSSGQPLPVNWDISIYVGALHHTLTSWTLLVLHEYPQPPRGPADDRETTLAAWLKTYVEWFRHQPSGWEFFDEIGAIVKRCRQVIDVPPNHAVIYVGPCPQDVDDVPCRGWVLAIIPDSKPAYMACVECKARWETWQWRRAGKRILERRTIGA